MRSGQDVPVGAERGLDVVLVLDRVVAGRAGLAAEGGEEAYAGERRVDTLVHRVPADIEGRRDVPLRARTNLPQVEVWIAVGYAVHRVCPRTVGVHDTEA